MSSFSVYLVVGFAFGVFYKDTRDNLKNLVTLYLRKWILVFSHLYIAYYVVEGNASFILPTSLEVKKKLHHRFIRNIDPRGKVVIEYLCFRDIGKKNFKICYISTNVLNLVNIIKYFYLRPLAQYFEWNMNFIIARIFNNSTKFLKVNTPDNYASKFIKTLTTRHNIQIIYCKWLNT